MKTLKQIFETIAEEEKPFQGQTTGTPGQGNWSMSQADLSKNFDNNPQQVQQMKSGSNRIVSSIMKQVAQVITPETLASMSDEAVNSMIDLIIQRIHQHLDTTEFQADKIRKQVAQEPGTKVQGPQPDPNDGGTKPPTTPVKKAA